MNFNYLHIDEKSISYKEMLSKFILNNDEANLSSDNYYEVIYIYLGIGELCKNLTQSFSFTYCKKLERICSENNRSYIYQIIKGEYKILPII